MFAWAKAEGEMTMFLPNPEAVISEVNIRSVMIYHIVETLKAHESRMQAADVSGPVSHQCSVGFGAKPTPEYP